MRRAHDGTHGTAMFSLRDEDGDIMEQTEIPFAIRKLSPEAVLILLQHLLDQRDAWEERMRIKHESPLGLGTED